MAYVVLLHLLYLLKSIEVFNVIRAYYTVWVQVNLIGYMAQIKAMMLSTSSNLYALMNKLIELFCRVINRIFKIIEAKLLFYLILVQKQIIIDYMNLYLDLAEFNKLLSELKSELTKYIQILENVRGLLKQLKEIITYNLKLIHFINRIRHNEKIIIKLYLIFSYQYDKISEIIGVFSTNKLEQWIKSNGDINNLFSSIINYLENVNKHSSDIIKMKIVPSLINKFHGGLNSIQKSLKVKELYHLFVSKEIMSIIGQLNVFETINFVKLNLLIARIQLKYYEILIRGYLLKCTILFYTEITAKVLEMIGLMKFECSNVSQFLGKCSQVENYIGTVSESIKKCITNLPKACNNSKCLGLPNDLLNLYSTIIEIIGWLKFYVDLMMMEILIFKNIIDTLIVMAVSSVFIDGLIKLIGQIGDIDKAIVTLVGVSESLKTFYLIQLKNTSLIFGLSNALMFSASIQDYYFVLLFNLQSIKLVIWAVECYIHHLIVFRHATNRLNSLIKYIRDLVDIIDQISKVVKTMGTITNKLISINKSITELNDIQGDMDITNWKQSAQGIRHQTRLISRDIGGINSLITEITGNVGSISKSFGMLIYLKYFLLVLIAYVYVEIVKTNKPNEMAVGVGNQYYQVMIGSVMEPCNKQLIFILGYLIYMWLYIDNLIKIVGETVMLIEMKMAWLKALTKSIQNNVDEINKGVVDMECAIEGVAKNLIQCSLQSTSNIRFKIINSSIDNTHNNNTSKYITKKNNMINTTCVTINNTNTKMRNNEHCVLESVKYNIKIYG